MALPVTVDHSEAVFMDLREQMRDRVDQEFRHIAIFLQITAFLFAAAAIAIGTDNDGSTQTTVLVLFTSAFVVVLVTIISCRIWRGHRKHGKLGDQAFQITEIWRGLDSENSKLKEVIKKSYEENFGKGGGVWWSIALVVVVGLAVVATILAVWCASPNVSCEICIFK